MGRLDRFTGFHIDNSFALGCWENLHEFFRSKKFYLRSKGKYDRPVIDVESWVTKELQEDLQSLVDALKRLGVTVRRPAAVAGPEKIQTPFWNSLQTSPLNVRDQTIVLGSCIVETAPQVRARLFENDYLKPLFLEYMSRGARWVSMPWPTLCSGALDSSYFRLKTKEKLFLKDHFAAPLPGLGFELLFDGAQCVRLGKDVLVNVANRNHELGYQWLRAFFGETFEFHRLNRMADMHIDSIILPLRDGLWLIRNPKYLRYLPQKFRKWEFIVAPERKKHPYPSYKEKGFLLSSKFLDMNVLSVDERTVIVNALYPELIEMLEDNDFKVIAVRHRHGRLFGGGFHCFTLDIRRDGELRSYVG